MKLLKEFSEISEASEISPGLKNAERELSAQVKKAAKQSLGFRKVWLDAEARSRVLGLALGTIELMKDDPDLLADFIDELDITPDEFNKLSSKVIIRDLFDNERDNALDFLGDDGIEGIIDLGDLEKVLKKSVQKVRA